MNRALCIAKINNLCKSTQLPVACRQASFPVIGHFGSADGRGRRGEDRLNEERALPARHVIIGIKADSAKNTWKSR